MGFKITGFVFFIAGILLLYFTIKKSQTRDKRFKKGYKNKLSIKVILKIIICIIFFYGAFKLITF